MQKLLVAFPLYHQVPATFFTRFLGMNKPMVTGHVTVDGVYLPISMGMIVDQALKNDNWDRLVIMESDTIPPAEAFERVAQYEQDIVGSVYFGHTEPHPPMVYIQEGDTLHHNPLDPETVKTWTDEPGLYECGAVGFGFTSIARHVLENWDKKVPMFEVDRTFIDFGSHDLWFCYQARRQGFKVFVDTGVVCDHLTEIPINLSHNQASAHLVKDKPRVGISKDTPTVLSVGSGPYRLAPGFEGYNIETLDIDPEVKPDILADARELNKLPKKYEGVYSSHSIEHFQPEDVPKVLRGFRQVLKPGGKALILTPDIGEVNKRLKQGAKETDIAYEAEGVGITYYDIIHGLQSAVQAGNDFMRHHTLFTKQSLTKALKEAGFKDIQVVAKKLELQAVASVE